MAKLQGVTSLFDRHLRRLAGAVLIQAVQDLNIGSDTCRREVRRWISGKDNVFFSFDLCCTLLGRSPEPLRRRLLEGWSRRRSAAPVSVTTPPVPNCSTRDSGLVVPLDPPAWRDLGLMPLHMD